MPSINYIILKSIIETTLKNYNTKEPHHKVNENHIFLVGVHQGGLDLLVKCPHTGKETNIHAEVNFMNVPNGSTDVSGITQAMNIPVSPTVNTDSVTDKDVMDVRQALKKTGSVEDLFGDKDNS